MSSCLISTDDLNQGFGLLLSVLVTSTPYFARLDEKRSQAEKLEKKHFDP